MEWLNAQEVKLLGATSFLNSDLMCVFTCLPPKQQWWKKQYMLLHIDEWKKPQHWLDLFFSVFVSSSSQMLQIADFICSSSRRAQAFRWVLVSEVLGDDLAGPWSAEFRNASWAIFHFLGFHSESYWDFLVKDRVPCGQHVDMWGQHYA